MAESAEELFERVAGARREWMACFDAITDYVFVKARDLRVVKANRAAASLFSRHPQQLIGHTCQSLYGCSEPPADEAVIAETFATRQPQNVDINCLPIPGEFHIATYPLLDDSGEVVAVVEFIRDVSEQKALQRQLLQSARLAAVGELAAGVAHNFGNILMGVGGSLEVMILLAEKEGLPPRMVERIRMMHRELMRGDGIVKRLLSFARDSTPSIRAVSPAEVISSVVSLCQAHPLCRGIDVTWDVTPPELSVLADPTQLREVLMNLLLNALQATAQGGSVRLQARPVPHSDTAPPGSRPRHVSNGTHRLALGVARVAEPAIALSVADTGCGIAEEDLPRLFTPFFSRRPDGSQGTGLGLCVSLGMVESMGGRIVVESRTGHGTTFTITLPAAS